MKGFTLVELLVVVGIMAVLSVIGISIYGGARSQARDARRRLDIDAIANALEANRKPGASSYEAMANGWFASGSVPTDSNNGSATYCAAASVTPGSPPATPTTWLNATACPSGFSAAVVGNPGAVASWTVCALLERGSNPSNIYCKKSAF